LTIAVSVVVCAWPAIAAAGHGGKVPIPPPSSGNNGGGMSVVGVKTQTGYPPQALTPIGTPVAPLAAQSNWEKFKDVMLTTLAAMDTPAGEELAQAQAVRAAIQDRDVRVASKNLPKRVAVAAK
jgi:hypothetical protein